MIPFLIGFFVGAAAMFCIIAVITAALSDKDKHQW